MLQSKGRRALLAGGLGVGLVMLTVPPLAATASATAPKVARFVPRHVLFDVGVRSDITRAPSAKSATTSALATFKATVTDPQNKTNYTYSMVGTNPEVKGTTSSTTVKTLLVPLKIVFPGASWDPTVIDSCDTGASALTREQKSPIFASRAWSFGGTAIGTGQYSDAFQRANFWKYTAPTGTNPSFSVNLGLTTLPEMTATVPAADAAEYSIGCGNKLLGSVNINWLDNYLRNTAIPALASKGVNASTVPMFLVHNVVAYTNNNVNDCCVIGYHSAYSHSGTQTYIFSDYDNSKAFSGFSDVAGTSHEVDEWMDDPFVNNPTAPWGHIGQVSGCQSNLEVGDPLSGTVFAVKAGTFTYHVQELAFFSWFYRQSPSIGVNGWYSDQGKFKSPAAACT